MRRVLRGQGQFGPSDYWTLPFFDPQADDDAFALLLLSVDGGNTAAGGHLVGDWATNQGWKLTREPDAGPDGAVFRLTVGEATPGEDTLDLNIPAAMWGRPIPVFAGRIAGDLAIGTVGNTGVRATPAAAYVPNNGTVSVGYDVNNAGNAVEQTTIYGAAFYQGVGPDGLADILAGGDLVTEDTAVVWNLNRYFQARNLVGNLPTSNFALAEQLFGGAATLGDATVVTDGGKIATRIMTP